MPQATIVAGRSRHCVSDRAGSARQAGRRRRRRHGRRTQGDRPAGAPARACASSLRESATTCARAAERDEIELHERRYEAGDLDGARLVYAATDDEAVNAARRRGCARTRRFSSTIPAAAPKRLPTPLAHRVGPLTFAVDTGGSRLVCAPLARRTERTLRRALCARGPNAGTCARRMQSPPFRQSARGARHGAPCGSRHRRTRGLDPATVAHEVDMRLCIASLIAAFRARQQRFGR